jgi:hypothetical protein
LIIFTKEKTTMSTVDIILPEVLPGFWTSKEGYDVALEYAKMEQSQLTRGDTPNDEVAARLNALTSFDLQLIVWQTAAKERIRWLSVQYAIERIKCAARELERNPDWVEIPADRSFLPMCEHSDFAIANAQYVASRSDPMLPQYKYAAAERLLWLHHQVKAFKRSAELAEQPKEVEEAIL